MTHFSVRHGPLGLGFAAADDVTPMAKAKTTEKPVKPDGAPAPRPRAQPDERDAAIARLERTVAEERQNAASLREANDALNFKLQIMEKSYAKQLVDARQRMDAALKELAGHRTRLKELGSGGEDTLRLLSETRAELNRIKAERNQMKEQLARGGGRSQARGELARLGQLRLVANDQRADHERGAEARTRGSRGRGRLESRSARARGRDPVRRDAVARPDLHEERQGRRREAALAAALTVPRAALPANRRARA